MRVYLDTLGCRLNEAELGTWSAQFRARGHEITPGIELADLVVLNTCAVTEEAVRKSRKLVRRLHRDNPQARFVISGCFATLEERTRLADLGVDLIVDNKDKDRLVEIASHHLALEPGPSSHPDPNAALLPRGRQRAFVKVQDGCRYRCTYCIVTLARGDERSRPIPEVLAEIRLLVAQGIREVVLTGVHLGGYGSDLGCRLVDLLRAILTETSLPRLRIGSLEPWELDSDFWDLFQEPRLMPHLHLPLQSGADSLLRRMARRGQSADYAALVAEGRRRLPDLNLTTDIIIGFPGETDAEWATTLAFVERMAFGHIHIFPFSPRQGTKAATLPDQVPERIKQQRQQELQALARQMKQATLEGFVDHRMPVLIESCDVLVRNGVQTSLWGGYTPNFLRVAIPGTGAEKLENQVRMVHLDGLNEEGDGLLGHIVAD